ncbi:AAA family ATPase [Williamsia muralis]|uniref:AAA family ATPase n=1 Tax=Williamsia marianensis TaxID=85044 RepID=UPI000DE67AED|nr:AAA family ATPase [Williamsia marianensis]PVY29919.1 AAA domain-containing protein [Williamsia marianensis]
MKLPSDLQRHLQVVPDIDEPAHRHFPPVLRLSELLQQIPAEPLIGRLLYRDALVQFAGPAGSFKSFVAVGLCCALASSKPWGRHPVKARGRVLYVAAEGGKGVGLRVAGWCHHYGMDPVELHDWFHTIPEPIQLGDPAHVEYLLARVRELQPALVVFDTRARSTVGLEENSATDQGLAIESAERIRRAADCTVLMVHHTGKSGNQRGTTAWPGAVWSELTLERSGLALDATGKPLGATVTVEKHKDAEIPAPASFDLVPVEVPAAWMPNVLDPTSRRTLVAVPADSPHTSVQTKVDRESRRQPAVDSVLEWLRAQHASTGRVPGRPTTSSWCKQSDLHLSDKTLGELIRQVKHETGETG